MFIFVEQNQLIMSEIKPFRNEIWEILNFEDFDNEREEMQVSNYGRIKKRKLDEESFVLVKQTLVNKFYTFTYPSKTKINKYGKKSRKSLYVHKVVANAFLEKEEGKKFVIHKNHDLVDNQVVNLKYVNQKELTFHQKTNPKRIKADKEKLKNASYYKLTETEVIRLKKKLNKPNQRTRMKMIAKEFGISTMQLYRIKTGENWGHVKV